MLSLPLQRFRNSPAAVLMITQLFSTISYAVLYSTLILFITQKLQLSATAANSILGLFIAFNYALHLVGGYVGGRLFSYRRLYIIGMILQIISFAIFAMESVNALYWAMAMYLAGAGLNVPCINMMLTQQFEPESTQREASFMWVYAAMNIGYLIGFFIAGVFQKSLNFYGMFIFSGCTTLFSTFIIFSGWKAVADHTTPLVRLLREYPKARLSRNAMGIILVLGVFFLLSFLLRHAHTTNYVILGVGLFMYLLFIYLGSIQKKPLSQQRIYAYVVLSLAGLVFWSLYQLAPMGLTFCITQYQP